MNSVQERSTELHVGEAFGHLDERSSRRADLRARFCGAASGVKNLGQDEGGPGSGQRERGTARSFDAGMGEGEGGIEVSPGERQECVSCVLTRACRTRRW